MQMKKKTTKKQENQIQMNESPCWRGWLSRRMAGQGDDGQDAVHTLQHVSLSIHITL